MPPVPEHRLLAAEAARLTRQGPDARVSDWVRLLRRLDRLEAKLRRRLARG